MVFVKSALDAKADALTAGNEKPRLPRSLPSSLHSLYGAYPAAISEITRVPLFGEGRELLMLMSEFSIRFPQAAIHGHAHPFFYENVASVLHSLFELTHGVTSYVII